MLLVFPQLRAQTLSLLGRQRLVFREPRYKYPLVLCFVNVNPGLNRDRSLTDWAYWYLLVDLHLFLVFRSFFLFPAAAGRTSTRVLSGWTTGMGLSTHPCGNQWIRLCTVATKPPLGIGFRYTA